MQSFSSAKESITGGIKSTFESIFTGLKIPYLVKSFDENFIYILMVLIIMIGLLVYIQIKNGNTLDKNGKKGQIIKEVEIKKVKEGFEDFENNNKIMSVEDQQSNEYNEESNDIEKNNNIQENLDNDPMYIMDIQNNKKSKKIEGFCDSSSTDSTTKLHLEKKCNDLISKEGCISMDCCSWTNYTKVNKTNESKCKLSDDKGNITFKTHNYDINDKIQDIDCVYYKNNKKGAGSKCN